MMLMLISAYMLIHMLSYIHTCVPGSIVYGTTYATPRLEISSSGIGGSTNGYDDLRPDLGCEYSGSEGEGNGSSGLLRRVAR